LCSLSARLHAQQFPNASRLLVNQTCKMQNNSAVVPATDGICAASPMLDARYLDRKKIEPRQKWLAARKLMGCLHHFGCR
jgi:hypothetical protein